MGKIKLVTDSTADLSEDLIRKYDIHVVPLKVHMEQDVYRDGVDISPAVFYPRLAQLRELPTTSQPSPGEFKEVYEKLAQDGSKIISIHLSSLLSGTYQSALLAKNMLPDLDITVIDSKSVTTGLGLILINVAKEIENGKNHEEIVEFVESLSNNLYIFFVVDTLEYLQKGGRIGKAQAMLGSLLNIKPLLSIDDGIVTPVEKVRGQKKALERLIQLAKEKICENSQIAIVNGANPDGAKRVKEKLIAEIGLREFIFSEVGPVVGTHAGPGVLGIAVLNI